MTPVSTPNNPDPAAEASGPAAEASGPAAEASGPVASTPSTPGDEPDASATGQLPGQEPAATVHLLPVRRSVKYVPFLLTGAVVGFVLGGLVGRFGLVSPGAGDTVAAAYSAGSAVAYLGALGALVGALVGAVVALTLDRRG